MQKGELDLIEKLIDLKLQRAIMAAHVAMTEDITKQQAFNLLVPIEKKLELTRQILLNL